MRWMVSMAAALLCLTRAGLPQDQDAPAVFRCLYDGPTGEFETMDRTAVEWLDTRIRSERGFLKYLFKVDPEFVLLRVNAPRDAFVYRDSKTGKPVIAFKAKWLIDNCAEASEHRAARVAYALAHQYAHVLQWKLGCDLPEIAREQQADMIAGWFLGRRNIATLKGAPPLDRAFATLLFHKPVPLLNERFEHGTLDQRYAALSKGFEAGRQKKRLPLKKTFALGEKLFPPPHVGIEGAALTAPISPVLLTARNKVKVACTHQGPCVHEVSCQHPKDCTHKVDCSHLGPCVHRAPCTHRVECRHHQRCVHRTECTHHVQCVHTLPCRHLLHAYDNEHDFDVDSYGNHVPCSHRIRCCHTRHTYDYAHNFDYAHEHDYKHEFDTLHEFDRPHDFDTEHEGDSIHEFDFAHKWDPIHQFDLAHEFDLVHDYDLRVGANPR